MSGMRRMKPSKQLATITERLLPGETILESVPAWYKSDGNDIPGQLAWTGERVLFDGKWVMTKTRLSFPVGNILSADRAKSIMKSTLTFVTAAGPVQFTTLDSSGAETIISLFDSASRRTA